MSDKCERCNGVGSYEVSHPAGPYVIKCWACVGSGLTESAQRDAVAAKAADEAWERFKP